MSFTDSDTSFSRPRRLFLDVLLLLFGMSSWISINGLWVEMPLIVPRLPEFWNLNSYVVVIIQIANLGPIIYSVFRRYFGGKRLQRLAVHVTIAIGIIACFLQIFFWQETLLVGNSNHSVAFLVLTFFLATVDCTSSVLYLPFMANFRSIYLPSLLIGEGLSGLVPSILSLIQGVGGNPECRNVTQFNGTENITVLEMYSSSPRFSVEIFFGLLVLLMIVSWTAFTLLCHLSAAKEEMVDTAPLQLKSLSYGTVDNRSFVPDSRSGSLRRQNRETLFGVPQQIENEEPLRRIPSGKTHMIYLLVLQCLISALTNGVLPAIQSFSCLPYGNMAYHFATSLSTMANPLACMIAGFFEVRKPSYLTLLSICGLGWACYIMTTAVLSPEPPLVNHVGGGALLVVAWVSYSSLFSYTKACLASCLRISGGEKWLYWCGVFTQVGSFVGAVVMFGVTNYTNTFTSYDVCAT